MQYYGTVLDLKDFPGHILIHGNTFTGNVLKYTNCDAATLMDTSSTAGFVDSYPTFGSKTLLQIRSVISIVKHGYKLEILGNTFTSNSGTKGIIYLDTYHREFYPVIIGGNTFTKNAGYIDSNVIFIRARGKSGVDVETQIPSTNANIFCNGYHF